MVLFRRVDPGTIPTERGTYRRIVELWKRYHLKTSSMRFWAELVCPDCGRVSMVGRNHMVDDGGNVSPSYTCPFSPCRFHEFVRLSDWNYSSTSSS